MASLNSIHTGGFRSQGCLGDFRCSRGVRRYRDVARLKVGRAVGRYSEYHTRMIVAGDRLVVSPICKVKL